MEGPRASLLSPDQVRIELPLAAFTRRLAAYLIDQAIFLALLSLLLLLTYLATGRLGEPWERNLLTPLVGVSLLLLTIHGWHILFEYRWRGATPGKVLMGIRVVGEDGTAPTLGQCFYRNLLRLADFMPSLYVLGVLLIWVTPRAQRLGDLVAGTLVVESEPQPLAPPRPEESPTARLSRSERAAKPAEADLLAHYFMRRPDLSQEVREELAVEVARAVGVDPMRFGSLLELENALWQIYQASRTL